MAHVGDEVPAHRIDATLLGKVLDEDDVRAACQRSDGGLQVEHASPQRGSAYTDLTVLRHTPLGTDPDEFVDIDHGQGIPAHQPQRLGPRRRPQDVAVGIDHQRGHGQDIEQGHDMVGDHASGGAPRGWLGRTTGPHRHGGG